MYLDNDLIRNHNYSIFNNKSQKNIQINIDYLNCNLSLSAVEKDKKLISPNFGTFSNFYINTDNTNMIKALIKKFFFDLSRKYDEFYITFPPLFYNQNLSFIIMEFLSYGAFIKSCELNNHIVCKEKFKFSRGNTKKLNKLLAENFTFKKGNLSDLNEAYDIIKENRTLKGYNLSMSFEKIKNLVKKFLDKFNIWLVLNENNQAVASAFTIDLVSYSRYVFYWGDRQRHDTNSPIVLMANELINENIKDGINILDLGTSSVNGKIDSGLKNFKNSLGAIDSLKITIGHKYQK